MPIPAVIATAATVAAPSSKGCKMGNQFISYLLF
jgi:hypothetical protein